MSTFRWGILGTGNIARSMAAALPHVPGALRHAVASRHQGTAETFAGAWGFEHAFGSYAEMLSDPALDIVYIATPNARHKDDILTALAAGKHVLCEKPMTLTPEDSAACFAAAATAGWQLMEALWAAFFPAMKTAIDLVQSGRIGTPRHLTASFVAKRDAATHPLLFDPALGGGARNDLGIYPIAAALLLAGPVVQARSQSLMGPTGVDEMTAFTAEHANGALSQLACGFRADLPVAVRCVGDRGAVEIPQEFYHPSQVVLETGTGREVFDRPYLGNGYAHEAIAFQTAITRGDGVTAWPKDMTLASAQILQS